MGTLGPWSTVNWIGNAILAVVNVGLAWLAVSSSPHWPPAATIAVAVLVAFGLAFTFPLPSPAKGSAFIRGNANRSRFQNVRANAETFIEGDAIGAVFRDIWFNSSTRGKGARLMFTAILVVAGLALAALVLGGH